MPRRHTPGVGVPQGFFVPPQCSELRRSPLSHRAARRYHRQVGKCQPYGSIKPGIWTIFADQMANSTFHNGARTRYFMQTSPGLHNANFLGNVERHRTGLIEFSTRTPSEIRLTPARRHHTIGLFNFGCTKTQWGIFMLYFFPSLIISLLCERLTSGLTNKCFSLDYQEIIDERSS